MKARYWQALKAVGVVAGFVAGGSVSPLGAQTVRTPDPNAPRLMVSVLRSSEKNLGVQAADAIRSRLNQDIPYKQLWVIPKNDINATLEASGFPTTEALAPHDAKALASLLRADEYVAGTVTKTASGFKVDANLVLSRDNALVQPLGSVEAPRLDQASQAVSKELQAARRQLDDERKCVNLFREQKLAEAAAAARQGIADYPRSTLARSCLANVMVAMKAPADSILAVSKEILAVDPRNKIALSLSSQAYKEAGQADLYIETLTRLLSTDPNNTRLQQQVAEELAQSKNPGVALPIIKQAVEANPGDPELLRTLWLIQLASRDYKGGATTGEEMIKADTAFADTTFFVRQAAAFLADSQPQKAAEVMARGVAKFQNNAQMYVTYAQFLRAAGQVPQATAAVQRALQIDPKISGVYGDIALAQAQAGQLDSAMATLRTAVSSGDTLAARYAVQIGNNAYRAAVASKRDADYRTAANVLTFADSITTNPEVKAQAQFLLGVNALTWGGAQLQAAQASKSCAQVKAAQDNFLVAQINLPKGGRFNADATKQALGQLQQLSGYPDQLAKAFKCR